MASLFKRHGVGSLRKSRKVSLGTQELDYLTQNTELKDSTMLRSYFDNFIAKHPKGYIKKKDFENILQQVLDYRDLYYHDPRNTGIDKNSMSTSG